MISRRESKQALAGLLAFSLACAPARALISLNDGRDRLYVTGTMGFGWDSNVFANRDAESDYTANTQLRLEYQRRAGWIGVNAGMSLDSTRYNELETENFDNPRFDLELTKQSGRTTGSVTLSAARQSRADAAVNVRSESWNYASGLNFRYPIVGIYTLSGSLGYSRVEYVGAAAFPDLSTYTAMFDLIRLFSSERDLMFGYRYRHMETSADAAMDDHAFTAGLTGRLIRGVNGSLRAGYQTRLPDGLLNGRPQSSFSSWTASGSATYAINKRMNLTGTLAKDFSTTANTISVDTTTASLDAQYAYSSHWTLSASASLGDNKFLGEEGRVILIPTLPPVRGPARHDTFASASVAINYSLNEHLKASASYNWFQNWSNDAIADFVRTSYNLNLSTRW